MLPPPVKGPPLRRILKAIAKAMLEAEVRTRLGELEHAPLGFIVRAAGARHRELKAAGRDWTEDDLQNFVEVLLPAAIERADAHAATLEQGAPR